MPAGVEDDGGFKMPVDPMRLLRAVWTGRRRVLIGAAIGLALGTGYAVLKAQTRYEVSLQLIKRFSPPTLQAGLNGEPYKPRQFTASTLASAASSLNVLDRVSRKSSPQVSVPVLKQSIKVVEDKLTDFVTLTLSGYHSPEATVELAKVWSEEVIAFTREMQAQESREIRKVIQTQLDSNQADLQRLDSGIIDILGGSLSSDMQIDTFVRSRADIDAKYDATKLELESLDAEAEGLHTELQRQTPMAEELRQARAELEQFRARYTDQNPLVVERMEKIASLEEAMKKQSGEVGQNSDLSNLASTYVGNQLYLTMVQIANRRSSVQHQLKDLEKQRDLFIKSPEKTSELMEMLQKKQMLRTAQALMLSRLQEVRIYEENAPAFYGVFAPADLDHVVRKSKGMKLIIFALGGGLAGSVFTLGGVLALAVTDRKLRTAGEAAKAMDAPLFVSIPQECAPEKTAVLAAKIWARWIGANNSREKKPRVVWSPAPQECESDFWRPMLAQARALLPGLLVVDCGETPSPEIAELPQVRTEASPATASEFVGAHFPIHGASLSQARELQDFVARWMAAGSEVWLRFDGAVQEPAASIVRAGHSPLALVALHEQGSAFFRDRTEMLRHSGAVPCGVVALNDSEIFTGASR